MATQEGTRASAEFMCVSIAPDVCKSPLIPVPYKILSLFNCAVNFSTNVRFRKQFVFRQNSFLTTVRCDEPGVGGGVISGVNMGWCRPIPGMHSKTVRVNKQFVDYHVGTYMFMNCAGPYGPFNTFGQVIFLGNMLPGPVAPSGKIPKGTICGNSGILSDIQSKLGDVDQLVEKGKKLYALAKTDWSNPSAVLGAIGGVAGLAGLEDIAKYAQQGKEIYDTGKKILDTDWSNPSSIVGALGSVAGVAGYKETAGLLDKGSKILGTDLSDPKAALGAVASAATIAGMDDIAKVAGIANQLRDVIKTDWSNPQKAIASATNILKSTGLNKMFAEMASNAILDNDIPVSQSGTTPPFFPKPGSAAQGATNSSPPAGSAASGLTCSPPPPSADGKPRRVLDADLVSYLQTSNPTAYARYQLLSESEKCKAFAESSGGKNGDGKNYDQTAFYIPGEGFTTPKKDLDALPNVSKLIPNFISERFVASKTSPSIGNFFGIKEKEGNVYLFGGLVDLGSPEMPGAGTTSTWWVPDRILNMDMSPYYDYHDKNYYGDNVGLGDIGKILNHELESFKKGAQSNPLQLPIQAIYSAATTGVGLFTAAKNTASDVMTGKFDSLGQFYESVFGESKKDATSPINSIVEGGCMGDLPLGGSKVDQIPGLSTDGCFGKIGGNTDSSAPSSGGVADGSCFPGQSAPGSGSGAPGTGAPPQKGKAGAPDGSASGAGKDGVIITIFAGNPAAAAAAIEKSFRAENQVNLEKAQAEEKAQQEKAAAEKAAKEKADKNDAAKNDAAKDDAAKDDAAKDDAAKDDAAKDDAAKDDAAKDDAAKDDADKTGHTNPRQSVAKMQENAEQNGVSGAAKGRELLEAVQREHPEWPTDRQLSEAINRAMGMRHDDYDNKLAQLITERNGICAPGYTENLLDRIKNDQQFRKQMVDSLPADLTYTLHDPILTNADRYLQTRYNLEKGLDGYQNRFINGFYDFSKHSDQLAVSLGLQRPTPYDRDGRSPSHTGIGQSTASDEARRDHENSKNRGGTG